MHLHVKYFIGKLVISSILVFLFCDYHEELKMVTIIASLVIFIICHFIEGYIFQKKLISNVKKK